MSQHLAQFSDNRHFSIGDLMALVGHIFSQDDITKESNDLTDKSPSGYVTIQSSFVAIGTLTLEI